LLDGPAFLAEAADVVADTTALTAVTMIVTDSVTENEDSGRYVDEDTTDITIAVLVLIADTADVKDATKVVVVVFG